MRAQSSARAQRIAVLRRLIATERELLDHPTLGFLAGRVLSEARHELNLLEADQRRAELRNRLQLVSTRR